MLRDFAFYVMNLQVNKLSPRFTKQIFELRETNRNFREKYPLN